MCSCSESRLQYFLIKILRISDCIFQLSCYEVRSLSIQTSLIHVIVGGAVDRSCPVGNRSYLGKNCEWQSVPLLFTDNLETVGSDLLCCVCYLDCCLNNNILYLSNLLPINCCNPKTFIFRILHHTIHF